MRLGFLPEEIYLLEGRPLVRPEELAPGYRELRPESEALMADTGSDMAEVTLRDTEKAAERLVEHVLQERKHQQTLETKISEMSQELEEQTGTDDLSDTSSGQEVVEEEPVLEKDYSEVGKRQSELIERFVDDKISVDVIAHELIEEQDRALAAEAEARSSQRDGEYEPVRGEAARYLELANEEKAARGLRGVPEAAFGSEGIRQVMLETQAAYRAMDQPTRMPELDRTFKTEEIEPERQV